MRNLLGCGDMIQLLIAKIIEGAKIKEGGQNSVCQKQGRH